MDPRRDEHDHAGLSEQRLRFLAAFEKTGVRELRVHLTVTVQASQVLRARDGECDEWGAEGAAPKLAIAHAIARRREGLVVADQRSPVRQLAIVAGLEPEDRPRRGNARRGRRWSPDPGGRRRAPGSGRGRLGLLGRSGRGGQRHGEAKDERAEHGAGRKYRCPALHRYGTLCNSTRRFCARPAAVLLGAM